MTVGKRDISMVFTVANRYLVLVRILMDLA